MLYKPYFSFPLEAPLLAFFLHNDFLGEEGIGAGQQWRLVRDKLWGPAV